MCRSQCSATAGAWLQGAEGHVFCRIGLPPTVPSTQYCLLSVCIAQLPTFAPAAASPAAAFPPPCFFPRVDCTRFRLRALSDVLASGVTLETMQFMCSVPERLLLQRQETKGNKGSDTSQHALLLCFISCIFCALLFRPLSLSISEL